MAYRWTNNLTRNDVTPERYFLNRRQVMAGAAAGIGLVGAGASAQAQDALEPNSWEDITEYNNFYEFGTDKSDPASYADALTI
ncbi:MAG: mononuclear molybdenum enzyme YedY, partial [Paracoccaceae bacterium]